MCGLIPRGADNPDFSVGQGPAVNLLPSGRTVILWANPPALMLRGEWRFRGSVARRGWVR